MTVKVRHEAQDRFRSEMRLLQRRLDEFSTRLKSWSQEVASQYVERLDALAAEVSSMTKRIDDWDEVEIGTPTQARHLIEELDALEADFKAASEFYVPDYELAMDQQVRIWKSRLDALRLQGVLGSMELKDELTGLGDRLEHARAGVMIELQNAVGDSGDLMVDVREDLEEVLVDVRSGLQRAYEAMFTR